jgi:hypothetical protein
MGAARKKCCHCRGSKLLSDFPRNSHTRDGLSSWCKDCHYAATREWRNRKREASQDAERERRLERNRRLREQNDAWRARIAAGEQ